jgi:serpin B
MKTTIHSKAHTFKFGRDGALAPSAPRSAAQFECELRVGHHSFRPLVRGRGRRKRGVPTLSLLLVCFLATTALGTDSTAPAAGAINSFGLDLLRKTTRPDANALLSPYSLETGLVMTYAGANGVTRGEMAAVLHLGSDEKQTHNSFGLLQRQINGVVERSAQVSAKLQRQGITNNPITLNVANRLFAQQGDYFKAPFTDLLKTNYSAPLQPLDFAADPPAATKVINDWVEQQTRRRIQNLLPPGALNNLTRLVLANAIYMKAPWESPFESSATKPLPFHIAGGATMPVPTMFTEDSLGYMKFNGFTAVTLPYKGDELQFLILLPDTTNGLIELESKIKHLEKCADLPKREVRLFLPRFQFEPPGLALKETLQELGMKTAFDPFKANFDRISDYDSLFIFDVYHKAFVKLDEEGTEAAAATAVVLGLGIPPPRPKPVEVRVDHPFMFAIQHRASGACLFLGHVVDPR